jgi:sphingolipid delta-4 desaturase
MSSETEFLWRKVNGQCHAHRTAAIKKQFPQVLELEGTDPWLALQLCLVSAVHITIACLVAQSSLSNSALAVIAWVFGGYFATYGALAMHEASHGLIFSNIYAARAIGFIGAIPLFFPVFEPFKFYHKLHHSYMSLEGSNAQLTARVFDPDLPTDFEAKTFSKSVFHRLAFVILMPLVYAIRPLVLCPRVPNLGDVCNLAFSVSYWGFVLFVGGPRALLYLFLSAVLGQGLHPGAMHFIAEHYVLNDRSIEGGPLVPDTYSYYGWQNHVMLNGGFHVEHHDFPRVPCRRLPLVRKIAAPFYDDLVSFSSYFTVMYRFLAHPEAVWSRVKRASLKED